MIFKIAPYNFNPHRHKGGDIMLVNLSSHLRYFNPHRHKGGDSSRFTRLRLFSDFNPHRHKGGDGDRLTLTIRLDDFNPHRHKGGDLSDTWPCQKFFISILTATRAVTDG